MEISLEQYEQIQDYLDNRMTGDQRRAFETRLDEDEDLMEHFLFEKQLRENLGKLQDQLNPQYTSADFEKKSPSSLDDPAYVRSMIETAGKNFTAQSIDDSENIRQLPTQSTESVQKSGARVIGMNTWKKLSVAACVIIVVGTGVWYTLFNKPGDIPIVQNDGKHDSLKKNNSKDNIAHNEVKDTPTVIEPQETKPDLFALVKEFFSKDQAPADKPQTLIAALDDYDRNKFDKIRKLDMDNIPTSKGSGDDEDKRVQDLGHYYKGITYLMDKGNSRQAISNLQWVVDSTSDNDLRIKARWYLALSYVKDEKPQKAKAILKELSKNNEAGMYKDQSQKLLRKLDSLNL